ncbi:non-ribosomal peptide synthetase [Salinicola rhizosphaerae]|uniref:Enterobactin synthase subunit F n=1 Tax=Salinicola rhizosphaerae TaxID=1443141 RepID=A0ABQ3EBI5_9GAMM|nr:non-ribosomal peptide synthetase [Salinicola rhizosphaerae]GHB28712.1 enterobactin synthase subunit F [Salinicola rhizosphaerae]
MSSVQENEVRTPRAKVTPTMRPLSEAQTGLWYAQQLAPDNPFCNTAHALWIEGELDVETFTRAADRVARETEALALCMTDGDTGPRQWVDPDGWPRLERIDLSATPQPAQAAQAWMREERLTPVDPTRDALACQRLLRLGERHFVWYLRVHHLATDGYGMALLGERLAERYRLALQAADETPERQLGAFSAVLDEDATYSQGEKRQRDAAWWRETLSGAPAATGLETAVLAPASDDSHRYAMALDATLREGLRALSQTLGQPWPDVLTALTAEYCRRHVGGAECIVGVPWMGRLGSASARVPAMVMNVLPLRVARADDVATLVDETATALMKARRHGRYRGEQIRRDLGLIGGQRRLHGPLINVQPFERPLKLSEGLDTRLEILATGPVDDVTLGFRGDAVQVLTLEIEANPALYDADQVEAHALRLSTFLQAAIETHARGAGLDDVGLATPAEAQRYLHDVNATAHSLPEATLVSLYEQTMADSPAAVALEAPGCRMTYAELERRTRALAQQLREGGVGRESVVAVAMPRSLEQVIALVAVQRAGGAYLPLDLAHPDERLQRILDSARPPCVLVSADARHRFHGLTTLTPEAWREQPTEATLDSAPRPQDAAYVIYTSGSTGEPKGVVVEHRAIVNRLEWMREQFGFSSDDRILQKTPATFDVSVWEFFLPLLAGATLVVAPPEAHRDPRALAALIREHRITTLHFVPSMLAAFLATPDTHGLTLTRVFVSGEALGAELRDRFHTLIDAELYNLYGPTEAAVDVSWWPAGREDRSRAVPIGYPVWNTRLYVLDARMRPLPPGVAGDLYLGGVQLARGYLRRPALTAERFIGDPHVPGGRLYKSGDIARWRRDGALEFLGRGDDQVKLRGLRIELGEIEAALLTAPAVMRAEVMLREDLPGEPRLVGYVQLETAGNEKFEGEQPDSERAAALRSRLATHLAARVPDYMIPAAFVALESWPLTANGKLDRRALPLPMCEADEGAAPRSQTERDMAALFSEVLGRERPPGVDADFFDLGGDSLTAVHLVLAIQQRWQRDIGLGAIFSTPTVAGLAALIDSASVAGDDGLGPWVRLSPAESDEAPLFAIHPAGGVAWNYRALARAIGRPAFGLQSPALDPEQALPSSIDALARDYVERVRELHPRGPVHLVGWSVGGIIAQAMAVRLRALGREVGLVALLDAYPAECWRNEPEPDPVAALRALLAIAGHDPEAHPELDSREKIVGFLRRGDSTLGNLPEAALNGVVRAVTGTNRLIRNHYHSRYGGTLLHLRAGLDHADRPELQAGLWQPYAREVEALELPLTHAEMTSRDAANRIAPLLIERLQRTRVSMGESA